MNPKLRFELQRLFLLPSGPDASSLVIDAEGQVRALVLELTRAPDWAVLGRVWQGVQAELELPAPGIAVSGVDALQLWFSLAAPVPVARARAFLDGLRQRFLAEVDVRRVRLWPATDATVQPSAQRHAALVPALQASGNWSAFVAPDLAPVFGDTPWLDIPPSEEGQANLLRVLAPMPLNDFEAALATMGMAHPTQADVGCARAEPPSPRVLPSLATASVASMAPDSRSSDDAQARRFLRQVMDDESAPLALRIEAAKALLLPPAR